MQGLSFFEKVIFIINTIVALLLLLSYGLSFLPPKQFGVLSVLSLGVPVFIIFNVLFSVYWLFKLKRQVLMSTTVLLLGFNYLTSMYQITGEEQPIHDTSFKVMSYNVRLFNLFNWIEDNGVDVKIGRFIKAQQPDILCLQEYRQNKAFELSEYYKFERLGGEQVKSGQAIYSKFPIINSGAIEFPNTSNDAIFVDVVHKTDTLRVYNLHLQSSKIDASVESLKNQSSENLFKRLSKTFQVQQSQAALVIDHIGESPYHSIITGDFNNTAYSYVYNAIKGDFQDTFETAGQGFGSTYDFKFFPFRIDFIMAKSEVEVNRYETFDVKYSDHLPIQATLNLHP